MSDIVRAMSGALIKEARRRADLTQQELAEALGTTQAQIARWELGKTSPSFERVVSAIRACGFDLAVSIVTPDDQHASLIEDNLSFHPADRLRRQIQGQTALTALAAKVRRPQ